MRNRNPFVFVLALAILAGVVMFVVKIKNTADLTKSLPSFNSSSAGSARQVGRSESVPVWKMSPAERRAATAGVVWSTPQSKSNWREEYAAIFVDRPEKPEGRGGDTDK